MTLASSKCRVHNHQIHYYVLPLIVHKKLKEMVFLYLFLNLHKHLKKINVTICNHYVDSPFYLRAHVYPDDLQAEKITVIHDNGCPYRDQVPLNNAKLTQTLS